MKTYRWLVALGAALALGAAACGGGDDSAPATTAPAAALGTIATADTDLGTAVVDANGMTLYLFEQDTGGTSSCDGDCAAAWPPATVQGAPVAGDGIDGGKLATTERADGTTQVTYDGHPLYRYAGDSEAGDTNGQGADDYGAEWYAVSPDGSAIEKKQGGGGYGGY